MQLEQENKTGGAGKKIKHEERKMRKLHQKRSKSPLFFSYNSSAPALLGKNEYQRLHLVCNT